MRKFIIMVAALFALAAPAVAQADGWHYNPAGDPNARIEATASGGRYLVCFQTVGVSDLTAGDNKIHGLNWVSCVNNVDYSQWRVDSYWNFDEKLYNAFTVVREAPDSPGGQGDVNGEPIQGLQINWTDVPPAFSPNWFVHGTVTMGLKAGWHWTQVGANCAVWPGGTVATCNTNSPMTGH